MSGIFFGCLRGRYKASVPMANAYIFSQFEQKNSQSEGHFYVNQYSLQIAFIFNGLLIKIKHMIRNKSDSMQLKRPCLRKYYKMNEENFPISVKMPKISQSKRPWGPFPKWLKKSLSVSTRRALSSDIHRPVYQQTEPCHPMFTDYYINKQSPIIRRSQTSV